jgi:hypothetical protein
MNATFDQRAQVAACTLHFCTSRPAFAATLVTSCNFSRQYAELIDVPIANEHLDSGCHRLIVGVSLGLASSLQRPQMLEFEHTGWCISIVSHDPSPHKCRLLTFAPNMAVSRHPLGAIWAAHLLAPNKKPRRYCGKIITNTAVPPSTYKTPLAARPCVPPVHWAGYCPATIRCPNRATIKNHSARRSSSRRSRIPQ